jgi:hypothetical protein
VRDRAGVTATGAHGIKFTEVALESATCGDEVVGEYAPEAAARRARLVAA